MDRSLELVTGAPEETRALGEAISTILASGDVVSLTGDLGAGKTTLVQGAAHGLGVNEPVLSPTFTLVRQYQGARPVYHLDIYRLDWLQEVLDLGFEEMLDREAVVFIEWGDAIGALLPEAHLQIELTLPEDGAVRRLKMTGAGASWAARWDRLEELAAPWKEG
jgi:tRNA threonylcarbamoyladenosine biosynthesis protein TsaE